jgi:predicted signal transduction protein with EAL and GGDEF domain
MSTNSTTDFLIIPTEEFDASNVTATEPKKKNERLQSYFHYNSDKFHVETNIGRAPFGIKAFKAEDKSNKTDYSLNISLEQNDKLIQNLLILDEYMIDFAVRYSKLIFKREYTSEQREVVRAMYHSSVKITEGSDYPPRIALKIQKKISTENTPELLFYHSEEEEVEIESFSQLEKLVPKGVRVKAIFSLRPWFVSGRFGVNLTIQQILVPKMSSGKPTSYAFSNKTGIASTKITASESIKAIEQEKEEEPEDEQEDDQKAGTDVESVEDSDVVEAQEEDEEEEEEPQPQKVVRKPSSAPVAAAAAKPVAAAKPRAAPARK